MYIQHPGTNVDYSKDWSELLREGELLDQVAVSGYPSGLLLSTPTISGNITSVFVQTPAEREFLGKSFRVTFNIQTSRGVADARSIFVKVMER